MSEQRRLAAILVAALVLLAPPAGAQTVADVERAWRDWAAKNERTSGRLALLHRGTLVHSAVLGRGSADQPVPLASLSKAITGVCIAGLIERGRLSFDSTVGEALKATLARVGQPTDKRLLGVTVAQLLTHRAGFSRTGGSTDPMTGKLSRYLVAKTARKTAFDDQIRLLLPEALPLAPGERYSYTNAPYLLLGAIVEEATGQTYEAHCRQAVLAPLGAASAALDPTWTILASYGGWRMAVADYGRFYQAFAPGNPVIGPKARAWMMSPAGKEMGGGAHYGLGTNVRPTSDGYANFWHNGLWGYTLNGYDGPLSASFASYAARWSGSDAIAVVQVEPALTGNMAGELDRALSASVGAVKNWP